ncbi:HEAT repeat domain-containing protein [Crocosphaera sp. UHCC 0190]|uniref:HEAT repeat domain-containing protein n=1 Tax=Crocosphaera sp. UHCC 0190 TaxID=3110246 RepID=UPI002B1EE66F|nr:HEAT repeat domain-containing protein [Crocosphaera sp. UHCC 0190]MEA5508773.1 HEAT repeat domain-containing protein [Crocosphaera sp. UHCC 0190]
MNYKQTFSMDNNLTLQQFTSVVYSSKIQEFDPIELGLYLLETGDFQQRWEVANLLPKLGDSIIDPLLNILENEEIETEYRWFVGRILGKFNDTKIIIAFVNLLQTTEEEELLEIAAEALGNMGIAAINNLEQLLMDDSSKLLAVKALAQIRHSETILPLLKVVDDSNPEIRAIAIESLGSFHDSQLIPIFIKALKDPIFSIRKEGIIALEMQPEFKEKFEFIKQIKPLLYDLNLEVCQQAAFALGRMKDQEATEALSQVLSSELTPPMLKKEVIKALNWTENPQALDYLQQALLKEKSEICQEIIVILGTQNQEHLKLKATQILMDFLSLDKPVIRDKIIKQSVALSLGELGDSMAIKSLNKLAKDPEKSVQLHALAALKKMSNS